MHIMPFVIDLFNLLKWAFFLSFFLYVLTSGGVRYTSAKCVCVVGGGGGS